MEENDRYGQVLVWIQVDTVSVTFRNLFPSSRLFPYDGIGACSMSLFL